MADLTVNELDLAASLTYRNLDVFLEIAVELGQEIEVDFEYGMPLQKLGQLQITVLYQKAAVDLVGFDLFVLPGSEFSVLRR